MSETPNTVFFASRPFFVCALVAANFQMEIDRNPVMRTAQ